MGVVVGVVLLKNRRVEHWEAWLRAGCCLLAGGLVLAGVVMNIVYVSTVRTHFKCEYLEILSFGGQEISGNVGKCVPIVCFEFWFAMICWCL